MSKKSLVAYFSASGVTARAAKTLAEAAGADLYEIKPKMPYTKADLNWMDKNARSSIEMKDPSSRPELADENADIASYDVIFLGFPSFMTVVSDTDGFNFSTVFPNPLPPDVANRIIVFPEKSYALRNVLMIVGATYHQIGNPKNITS